MKRVTSILLILLLTILLLLGVVLFVLLTPAGQEIATTQVNKFLKKKLNTRVEVGQIRLQWPKGLGLDNLYIEDLQGDTLVAAVRLQAGLDMWGLLRGKIVIGEVEVEGVRGNVYRKAPEKDFNYQFVVDAFASEDTPADTTSGSPLDMSWDRILVKKVHLSYYDDAAGIDTDVKLPEARVAFTAFNPSYSRYHPTEIMISDAALGLRMFEPVDLGLPVEESVPSSDSLDLKLGEIDFRQIKVKYVDEVSGLTTDLSFPKLLAMVDHVYLDGQRVGVRELEIADSRIMVEFEKKEQTELPTEVPETETPGWVVTMGALKLKGNEVKYDDENIKPIPNGLDYSHLHLTGLEGELSNFIFSPDSTAGKLTHLQFAEKSGFRLEKAASDFAYTSRQAFLKNLVLQTPNTSLGDHVVLKYADTDQLTEDIGKVGVEMSLANSRIGFRDLLFLAPDLAGTPPFDSKPNGYVQGNASLTGTVDNLQINEAVFTMPEATRLSVTGDIKGLPDVSKLAMNLTVEEVSATGSDLLAIIPKGTLPDSLQLPETLSLKGNIEGSLDALKVDAGLQTDLGNVYLSGDFLNMTDSINASYNGNLTMEGVNVGRIMMQPADQLGVVSLKADFSGTGLTSTDANARLNGTVDQAEVLGYTYRGLILSGSLQNGLAAFDASSGDPNVDLNITGRADLNREFPAVDVQANVNNLDLNKLNLYSDTISLAGNFSVNLTSSDPDNPLGEIKGTEVVVKEKNKSVPVGTFGLSMTNDGQEKNLTLESPFANATLKGVFNYTAIGDILTGEINRYIQLSDTLVPVAAGPYSLELSGSLQQHDAIRAFVPELTKMEPVNFLARLSDHGDTTLTLSALAPEIVYDSINITGLAIAARADGEKLTYSGKIDELLSGSFRVRNFNLRGDVADNQAVTLLTVKDSLDKNQHLAGVKVRKDEKDFVIGLQNRLLLNYVPWRSDSTGYIRYGEEGLFVKDFTLFRNRSREKLIITSVGNQEGGTPYPNGPVRISADSIAIGPLVEILTRDPKLAAGRLDGDINIRDYMGEAPVFEGEISVNNFEIQEVSMGDFQLRADNRTADVIDLVMTLKGVHNDVSLDGKYRSGAATPLDFRLNMNRLDAKLIEAFSFGELRNGAGNLSGNLIIKGGLDNPSLTGDIGFKDLAFRVSQLGARYAFEDGSIGFDAPLMKLNNLTVVDTLDQRLSIDGAVSLTNIPDVGYNISINTDRFMLLNASRKDNDLVYGRVFAGAKLSVKGKGSESIVDGTVKLLKESDVTLILPDDESGLNRGDGIVEFVKRKEDGEVSEDSVTVDTRMVVDFASELSLNIETDPDAEFTIVLDERNGDNLRVRGNANLNTGLAPNGQLYLLGTYELAEGAYELTFEILKREFEIRKGSQIIWSGDPMQAELDIVAVYGVEADPSAFSPTNYNYGKVPFNVLLRISGNLSNPKIVFDLEVDDSAGSAVRNKIDDEQILSSFRNDASEMNKQVFGLLLLNKFMAETSNISFGGFSAEAIARQSVSKMLSDQLNYLASDLIKGVQLDFNLNSTTGATGGRTDLNVGLTKGFLNDRVTVSVGRNFELENSGQSAQSSEIFDNIAVNYKITRDGRYVLRAYRKNQFQTVLEGFIVETGVSFIVTLDYDAVKEFFEK